MLKGIRYSVVIGWIFVSSWGLAKQVPSQGASKDVANMTSSGEKKASVQQNQGSDKSERTSVGLDESKPKTTSADVPVAEQKTKEQVPPQKPEAAVEDRAESPGRTNWVIGGDISTGVAAATKNDANQYQPLLLFQAHAGYDFTSHQCVSKERRDSLFCTEALVQVQLGAGYLVSSDVALFRVLAGFEFDFYFGTQRAVALTLKWRMGYGRYGLASSDQQGNIPELFQLVDTDGKNRLEFGLGPGLLVQLGQLVKQAQGVGVYLDVQMVSPYTFGFVGAVGAQYRF